MNFEMTIALTFLIVLVLSVAFIIVMIDRDNKRLDREMHEHMRQQRLQQQEFRKKQQNQ